MTPLILDAQGLQELHRIKAYGESHITTFKELQAICSGHKAPVGDDPEYTCRLPLGFKVVFFVEMQPGGKMRHLSMSSATPGRVPNVHAVTLIMKELGFTKSLEDCVSVWKEDPPGAINVLDWF